MKTATFVKFLPSYLNGSLYQLSHPVHYVDEYRHREKATFLNVKTENGFTEAFPANLNGHFACTLPLMKARIEGKNHEECLKRLGYHIINQT